MTYEEYSDKITNILSNPDTALAEITPVLEALKEDLARLDAANGEIENLNGRVSDLQETNIKLFLSQNAGEPEDDEDEDEDEKEVEAFFEELKGDL